MQFFTGNQGRYFADTIDVNAAGEKLVFMSQPSAQFKQFNGDHTQLSASLGITTADLHSDLPIVYGSTGRWTLIVPVCDLDVMRRMRPQTALFPNVLVDVPEASIHPFCMETIGKDADMHARHFSSPSSGTVEYPVTGTASGVLGAYYRKFFDAERDVSQPLVIEQGYEVGREGQVLVWAVKNADGYAVRIAGGACYVDEQQYP